MGLYSSCEDGLEMTNNALGIRSRSPSGLVSDFPIVALLALTVSIDRQVIKKSKLGNISSSGDAGALIRLVKKSGRAPFSFLIREVARPAHTIFTFVPSLPLLRTWAKTTIMGTSMVIGDGVLTPSISVLSAVSGIHSLGKNAVVGVSVLILVLLFSVQRFGTDKVGFAFAPIIMVWFLFISGIGLYNLFVHDIGVLRAFNPMYIVQYFQRNRKKGWVSLGGIFLCITGTKAMFADLGHFNVKAIQVGFSCVTFPALITAYCGQAAYLRKFPDHVEKTFYNSIPAPLYWPTLVMAVAAAIIASQAMISGAFAIISQSLTLGCFPRVKVVHTSAKYQGQVYIPEVNFMLMIASVMVTAAFQTTEKIGNAYGIAVVSVMVITTGLLTLIMLVIWKTSIWLIALFLVGFLSIEAIYLSSVLYKFVQGGFLPLVFASLLMAIWHYVHKKRYMFELNNRVSSEYMTQLASNPNINRVPGTGLLYSELVQGIPPIFSHFISNIPSIHSVVVIVSIKRIPLSKVAVEERFLFRQLEPREYRIFRCVARYGYNDRMEEPQEFEQQLIENLKEYIRNEHLSFNAATSADSSNRIVPSRIVSVPNRIGAEEEMQFVQSEMEKGIVYLLGETEVVAAENASFFKKLSVNYFYDFLRKNFRQGETIMATPRSRLLRVGMTYEI
ncbi:hypothetical protein ACLB2K_008833 [Fragaria x ananassa]